MRPKFALSGTETLYVISIEAAASIEASNATEPPSVLRYLFAQVTFCGEVPTFSLEVSGKI